MLQQAARQAAFIVQAFRDERRSATQVQRLQDARLRATVRHAWQNSRLYRDKFERAGLRPDDIRTVADLVHAVHAHPTMAEGMHEALESVFGSALHI